MRDLRMLGTQARYALLTTARSPRALVFGVIFPILLLVLFNSIFAKGDAASTKIGDQSIATKAYYTAGIAAYAIMVQTFTSLAITITTQRESGQLKRLRGTPVPAWTFITAYIVRSVVYVAAMVVALFAIGVLAFDVHLHGAGIPGMILYVLIGTVALAALGIAVTIVCPSAEAASAIGPFAAVLLSFISGVFIPVAMLPSWLQTVGDVFPLAHLASGLQQGLVEGASGSGLDGMDLGVLAVWAVAGLLLATWRFHWEPQSAAA